MIPLKRTNPAIILAITISCFVSWSKAPADEATQPSIPRPAHWAVPLKGEGLENFHKVSDGLYRGAKPSAQGMKTLEKMGIKTIVNLRGFHSDSEKLAGTKLKYIHIRFQTWQPEEEDMIAFLKIVNDPSNQPVFVHCQHGADRTGTMVALYRLAVQGWTKDEAVREMTQGGYNFHSIWDNLITFIRNLDIEHLRKAASIEPGSPGTPSAKGT
jgi:protein tyrosine/serine phosphatase